MEQKKGIKKEVLIEDLLSFLKERYDVSDDEILQHLKRKAPEEEIPIDIFNNPKLSALETISKYLRENCKVTFSRIGELTNRDPRVIGTTYHNAIKKYPGEFTVGKPKFYLPVMIIKEKKLSVLENIVSYMKDSLKLNLHEIALFLNRDDSTVWTVYNRAKKKNEKV